jgi:hypothetical protein
MKTQLADFYLQFLNDFLTVERFAEWHGMPVYHCQILLNLGRDFHEDRVTK